MKRLIFIFSLFFSLHLSANTIHLLSLLGDNDEFIAESVRNDIANGKKVFSYIAEKSGIPINVKEFSGEHLTYQNIMNWIDKETILSDDILILHYAGHGARKFRTPTIWPIGIVKDDKKVDFAEIVDYALSKNAAFSLVLLDCCNAFVRGSKGPKSIPNLEHLDGQRVTAGFKTMFLNNFGLIISSGAIPGRYAYNENEGYFTSSFLSNLIEEMQRQKPSWNRVFRITQSECYHLPPKRLKLEHGHQLSQHKLFLYPQRKSPRAYKWHLYNSCLYKNFKKPKISK